MGYPSRLLTSLTGMNRFIRMVDAIVWDGTFHSEFLNKEKSIEIYEKHVEEVKKVVPEEKLLVYSVEEGWAPLCRFLDLPVRFFYLI